MKRIILVIILGLCVACNDIIEPTVEKEKVQILTPNDSSSTYLQSFYWEKVDNATAYQIRINQLNSGDSSFMQIYLVDSTVKNNIFKYSMQPGLFEFKVKALNSSSVSDWSSKIFKILPSNLNTQSVSLSTPSDNGYQNNSTGVNLVWQSVYSATTYKVQIDTLQSLNSPMALPITVYSPTYDFGNLESGKTYYWRVKALNTKDSTDWSVLYSFTYDITVPNQITSGSPNDNTAKAYPKDSILTWDTSNEPGVTYTVKIKYNATTTATTDSLATHTETANFTKYKSPISRRITWWVLVTDRAGNTTLESNAKQFSFNASK